MINEYVSIETHSFASLKNSESKKEVVTLTAI